MKKLTYQIMFDALLYFLLYLAIAKGSIYAENVVSFLVVFMGVLLTIASFSSNDYLEDSVRKHEGKFSLSIRYWCRYSTAVEVAIFASQGWYVMAALWFFGFIAHLRIHAAYDKLFGKPKLI